LDLNPIQIHSFHRQEPFSPIIKFPIIVNLSLTHFYVNDLLNLENFYLLFIIIKTLFHDIYNF